MNKEANLELELAIMRLALAVEKLKRVSDRRASGRTTCRSIAKRTVRYALNPAEAVVDGIEAVVDFALDD